MERSPASTWSLASRMARSRRRITKRTRFWSSFSTRDSLRSIVIQNRVSLSAMDGRVRVFRVVGRHFWSYAADPTRSTNASFVFAEILLALALALKHVRSEETKTIENALNSRLDLLAEAIRGLRVTSGNVPAWVASEFSDSGADVAGCSDDCLLRSIADRDVSGSNQVSRRLAGSLVASANCRGLRNGARSIGGRRSLRSSSRGRS